MAKQKNKPGLTKKSLRIVGVIPPMMTPFRENEAVDFDMFARNVERWNKEPLGGYVVLGSNSEASYLSENEKLRLISLTKDAAKKGRVVIAGTGLESARETIRFTEKAAMRGANAALVLTPSYYIDSMTDGALIDFFRVVADRSPIPVLIYNVPKFTHVNVSTKVVEELSVHPNIVGMKDSKGDARQLEEFRRNTPADFQVIAGTASVWYPSLQFGVKAGIMALSNFAGRQCALLQSLFNSGENEKAESLHRALLPVNAAVTATYGVPGLKYAATLAGYEGGNVRRPLQRLSEEAKRNIRDILLKAGLLSSP